MSLKSQNSKILYKYLKAKIQIEKQLDFIRSELHQIPNFNAFHLFNQIDYSRRGRIIFEDIMTFLVRNDLSATQQQIRGVMFYFTKNNFISLSKFIQCIVPKINKAAENYTEMCTMTEGLVKLFFSIIDHNDQIKTILKLAQSIDQNNFDFNFGILTEFTPQHLVILFNSFNDQLDGVSFQIIFGNSKTIPWQSIKETFKWKQMRRQSRPFTDIISHKRQILRKTSFNSALLSDISTDHQTTNNNSKIKFCTNLDIDIFDRETYLQN